MTEDLKVACRLALKVAALAAALLLALFILAGCGITPETPPAPSQALADYDLVEYDTSEVESIPSMGQPVPVDQHGNVVDADSDEYVDHFRLTPDQVRILDAILEIARENTAALRERNRQVDAMDAERVALLQAGRLAEIQARAYHGLWVGEVRQGWLDSLMYRGVTGLAVALLAAGAL